MIDAVVLSCAAETERYEMAVYRTLAILAESLGAPDVVERLRENLGQERQMHEEVRPAIRQEVCARAGHAS